VTVVKYDIGCMAITISVMLCVFGYVYISDICILSKKIYYLFVRAFDTGRKSSICKAWLVCPAASANKF